MISVAKSKLTTEVVAASEVVDVVEIVVVTLLVSVPQVGWASIQEQTVLTIAVA